jgi:hypothetical protein
MGVVIAGDGPRGDIPVAERAGAVIALRVASPRVRAGARLWSMAE